MPYIGKKPADIIATVIDTTTGTFSGEVDAGSLDVSGNADIDGITNLDNTDIDGTLDVSGDLTVDTNTLYVDSSNNRVGVGTSSPSTILTVSSGASSASVHSYSNLEIESSSHSALQFSGSTAGEQWIWFADDTTATPVGGITYYHAGPYMGFRVEGSERMRINDDGNVLIGRTSELTDFGDGRTSLVLQGTGSQDYATIQIGNNGTASDTQILGILAFYDGTQNNARVQAQRASSTDSANLLFWTRPASGSLTERMRIDSSGRVSIGTSTIPTSDSVLTIRKDGSANEFNILSGTSSASVINMGDSDDYNIQRIKADNTDNSLHFQTNNSEKMRIDSSGNLLVGKTSTSGDVVGHRLSPDGRLLSTADSNYVVQLNRKTSDGSIAEFRKDGSTVGSITSNGGAIIIGSSDVGVYFDSGSDRIIPVNVSTNSVRNDAIDIGGNPHRFKDLYLSGSAYTSNIYGQNDTNTGIQFEGSDLITIHTGGAERMRIHSTGATSFGTSDASPFVSTEGHVVALNDGARYGILTGCDNVANREAVIFVNPNGQVGSIRTNGTAASYNTASDHRLKENVTADWDATTRLKQLNPVRFNFIADADTTVDGFLAHEVQSVVPEAISGTHNEVDDDGNPVYQGIDQSKLVPLLVKTIQELEARIVALENA